MKPNIFKSSRPDCAVVYSVIFRGIQLLSELTTRVLEQVPDWS